MEKCPIDFHHKVATFTAHCHVIKNVDIHFANFGQVKTDHICSFLLSLNML